MIDYWRHNVVSKERQFSSALTVEMEVEYRSYYRTLEYFLSSFGQWPYQTKFKQQFITIIISLDIPSFVVPQILGIVKSWGDIDSLFFCIPSFLLSLIGIISLINCSMYQDKLKLLLYKMKKDWSIWTTGPEVDILRDYASQGRKFMLSFTILIYLNMCDFILLPLVPSFLDVIMPLNNSRPKKPIFITEYFIDPEDNYYWLALHGCVTTTIICSLLLCLDSIFITVLYHACGELKILGLKLKNLVKIDEDSSNIDNAKIEKEIKFCAEKHESVLIFVDDISDFFSTGFFLILGLNSIMMSVTMVQAVACIDHPHDAYRFMMFVVGEMFHLFCLTVPCQYLIDHSIQLSESIYNGYWYQMSCKSQKLLLMIMMRSSKPCSFTAGSLYTFSMENFATVVKTSMSYFTVLASVRL